MTNNEPKRVFCKDCVHYGKWQERYVLADRLVWRAACLVGVSQSNPIEGDYLLPVDAETKNKGYDCGDFCANPEPKRPWWRIWR